MNVAYQSLITALDEAPLKYFSANGERQTVCLIHSTPVGMFPIVMAVRGNLLTANGAIPFNIPPGCRVAIAETIARTNYGLPLGKFELDFEGGASGYQAATIIGDGSIEKEAIYGLLACVHNTLNRYVPAIMSVVFGNEEPSRAVDLVESNIARME